MILIAAVQAIVTIDTFSDTARSMGVSIVHGHITVGLLFAVFLVWSLFIQSKATSNQSERNTTILPTESTQTHQRQNDSCVLPSQQPKSYSQAEEDCNTRNLSLLGPEHLTKSNLRLQTNIASFLNDTPWTFWYTVNGSNTNNCSITNGSNNYTVVPCTQRHNYFCIFSNENTSCSNYSAPARNTPVAELTTSTHLPTTREPPNTDSVAMVIYIAVPVIFLLVIIAVVIGCYILKRHGKPIKYAVRKESAKYHKNNPEEQTEATIEHPGDEHIGQKDTYDTLQLKKLNGTKSKSRSDECAKTKIYDHLSRDENDYDTTGMSRFDKEVIDKPYDKTYFGQK